MQILVLNPVSGSVLNLENVNDEVFSSKLMGEGVGILPDTKEIFSPIDGTVVSIFPTLHAIGLRTENDIELLIHVGIDTFELGGKGFEVMVEEGQLVSAGDHIMNVDFKLIKDSGYDETVILVCTKGKVSGLCIPGCKSEKTEIFRIDY